MALAAAAAVANGNWRNYLKVSASAWQRKAALCMSAAKRK
jgi:hypothetical protein